MPERMTKDRTLGYTAFIQVWAERRNLSSVSNPVPLAGGNGVTELTIVALGLQVVSVSGGPPGRVLVIWREGTRNKRSGRWP